MAMKETERSLRSYFLFVGAIAVVLVLRDLGEIKKLSGLTIPFDKTLAIYVPLITRGVLGVAFLVAGVQLKRALVTGAGWIKTMLVVSGAMLFINGALVTWAFGSEGTRGIVTAAVGLALTIYLHRNVSRLAAEAAAREGIAPPPPAAKVV